ncbi:MAG: hypothetical protein IKG22_12840 [Atopobiaceae bacterium]|nr:hypothetical protein [Atopobiaceae bacterium]
MNTAPTIEGSTAEERLAFIRERYVCISNCDACGICATFHGKDPETVLADYIDGKEEYKVVLRRLRSLR